MVAVTFLYADETSQTVDIAEGTSLMEGAVRGGLDGIDADCGGAAACATCHVYIARDWMDRVPLPGEQERAMLEFVIEPNEQSRLSCQIFASDALEGLVVTVPETQR